MDKVNSGMTMKMWSLMLLLKKLHPMKIRKNMMMMLMMEMTLNMLENLNFKTFEF